MTIIFAAICYSYNKKQNNACYIKLHVSQIDVELTEYKGHKQTTIFMCHELFEEVLFCLSQIFSICTKFITER